MKKLMISFVLGSSLLLAGCNEGERTVKEKEVTSIATSEEAAQAYDERLKGLTTIIALEKLQKEIKKDQDLSDKDRQRLEKDMQAKAKEIEKEISVKEERRLTEKLAQLMTASEVANFQKNIQPNEKLSTEDKQSLLEQAENKYATLRAEEQNKEVTRLRQLMEEKSSYSELATLKTNIGTNNVLTDQQKQTLQNEVANKQAVVRNKEREEEVGRLRQLMSEKKTGPELQQFKQNVETNHLLTNQQKQTLKTEAETKRQQWVARQPKQTTGNRNGQVNNPSGTSGTVQNNIHNTKPPTNNSAQRFKNCTEMRKVHPNGVPKGHPAYEPKHDRDKDGWACER